MNDTEIRAWLKQELIRIENALDNGCDPEDAQNEIDAICLKFKNKSVSGVV